MRRGRLLRYLAVLALVAALVLGGGLAAGGSGSASAGKPGDLIVIAPPADRFEPGTGAWEIPFSLIDTSAGGQGWAVDLAGVSVDGQPVPAGRVEVKNLAGGAGLAPLAVGRWVDAREVREYAELRRRAQRGPGLTPAEGQRLQGLVEKMRAATGAMPFRGAPHLVSIPAVPGPAADAGAAPAEHELKVTLRASRPGAPPADLEFTVAVTVASTNQDESWLPGDYHLHSVNSDGTRTVSELRTMLIGRGYRLAYLTDHSDRIWGNWASYASQCTSVSDSIFSMFPGTEVDVGYDGWLGYHSEGHLLAYGIKDLAGLDNQTYRPQPGIDNINNNNPERSSPSIAHPYGSPDWEDWTVQRYRGQELMSGSLQLYFDSGARPMTRWQSELTRLLPNTFAEGYFSSPRTGSDYHGYWFEPGYAGYVTFVRAPADWSSLDYDGRRSAVDQALRSGTVVASRKGTLATFTLGGNGIGAIARGIAAGSTLALDITLRPAVSGNVTVTVYRDNKAETVFSRSVAVTAGQAQSFSGAVTFPAGNHYYWLYVSGDDYVYTSPAFVTSN